MLTGRYLSSVKNVPDIFRKIVEGAVPEKFTTDHLKAIGFGASGDRAIVPLMKDLGFLGQDGAPTQRYREYRDTSRSKGVMGEALREAYSDLFVINERLSESHRDAIEGRFKAVHGATDTVARVQAMTFLALAKLSDLDAPAQLPAIRQPPPPSNEEKSDDNRRRDSHPRSLDFKYNIEIHLPATKDIEIYNAIFKSMKDHLLDE